MFVMLINEPMDTFQKSGPFDSVEFKENCLYGVKDAKMELLCEFTPYGLLGSIECFTTFTIRSSGEV